jgi:hypothetical protein
MASNKNFIVTAGLETVGPVTGANTLAVTGNATFSNTIAVTGNATFSNSVAVTGLVTASGNLNAPTINASAAINVGANVNLDTTQVDVGNSSVNSVITSTNIRVGNSIVYSNVTGAAITTNGTITVQGAATLSSTLAVTGNATFSNNVIISGNLTVSGTTTYVNTATLNIADNIVTLNSDLGAVSPTENAGIEVNRGSSANSSLFWNETNDQWELAANTTNSYKIHSKLADIALGTDTSGNYVASVANGTGVLLSGTAGEGWTPTLSIGQDVGQTATVQFGRVYAGTATANVSANASLFQVANSIATANITPIGLTVGSSVINSVSIAYSTNFVANSLGAYHTGTMNAASFTTTGLRINTTAIVPTSNTSGQLLGNTISRFVISANTIDATGLVFAQAGLTVTGTANASLGFLSGTVNSSSIGLVANTSSVYIGNSSNFVNVSSTNIAGGANAQLNVVNAATVNATSKVVVGVTNATSIGVTANTSSVVVGNSSVTTVINTTSVTTTNLSGNGTSVTSVNAAAVGGNTATTLRAYSDSAASGTAATAYTNAIATAASDATTKAGTAYTNAIATAASDATTKAGTAYTNAIAIAASDASTKAGTAYSNAISVAAADATTKAGTAYSNAISVAAADATTKAGTAYTNALSSAASLYQTTAGLSANVAKLTSNNTSYLNGQLASFYTDIPSRLGYTPIQQGGGTSQGTNKLYIGWSSSGATALRLQVDSTDFGTSWPISVTGSANDSTNLGGSSLATVQGQITGNAATAYTNAIAIAANATNLTSGTVPIARIGTGTKDSSTILYGNNTFAAAPTSAITITNSNTITGGGTGASFTLETTGRSLRHITAGYASGNVSVSATAPSSPAQGDIWFDPSGATGYEQSLSSPGYTKLPNGLYLQWGYSGSIAQDSSGSGSFYTSFPTVCLAVIIVRDSGFTTTGGGNEGAYPISTSAYQIWNGQDATSTFYYLAIGY